MRLRFTIRDLLWLAALVAVCLAWVSDRAQIARERAGMVKSQKAFEIDAREITNELNQLRADHDILQQLRLLRLRPSEGPLA
jgi:hypothetical protein